MLKDLQEWKEAPLDCVLLALYQLQAFYSNEIKRGFAGLGEYTVFPKYKSFHLEQFSEQYLPTCSPVDIVKNIRDGKVQNLETLPHAVKVSFLTIVSLVLLS